MLMPAGNFFVKLFFQVKQFLKKLFLDFETLHHSFYHSLIFCIIKLYPIEIKLKTSQQKFRYFYKILKRKNFKIFASANVQKLEAYLV